MVFASVGTDHHRFDRLVHWLDDFARERPEIQVIVQHGSSTPPRVAIGYDYLSFERLMSFMAAADVLVCHGGPGTIMDARANGHLPVCVPRDPALGEHVDGHQMRFVELAKAKAIVVVAADHAGFGRVLAEKLAAASEAPVREPQSPCSSAGRQAEGVPALAAELERILEGARSGSPSRTASLGRYLQLRWRQCR